MTVFRLTDAAGRERETASYWRHRVQSNWQQPFHGIWKGDEADTRPAMDSKNLSVIEWLTRGLPKPVRLLDAACGYGRLAGPLAALCDDYVGIDIVEQQILAARAEATKQGIANAQFYTGDIGYWKPPAWMPYAFSLIVSIGIWSSIESRSAEVVAHLRTLLEPGGKIAVFERDGYLVLG